MLFKRKKEETAKPKNIADILTYQAAERGHKKYLFFKDINREEFDEFVKKMNIVIYYKAIIGQK